MNNHYVLTPYFLDHPAPRLEQLLQPGWQLNRPALSPGSSQARMTALHRPLAALVADATRKGRRPVSVAGDCCSTIGVLSGLQQAGLMPTLIWLDAHGDFNTWETTPSGFLGGMPLAMLVGLGEQTMLQGAGLQPFPQEKVILADARDLDPEEGALVKGSQITHLDRVTDLLSHHLPPGPLYIHFDVDVLDPEAAPAVSYPAPGGCSPAELEAVFRHLAQSKQVEAVSMSSWDPDLDSDGRTAAVCMGLLGVLLGH